MKKLEKEGENYPRQPIIGLEQDFFRVNLLERRLRLEQSRATKTTVLTRAAFPRTAFPRPTEASDVVNCELG